MGQTAVHIHEISKVYKLYTRPADRLKETFHPARKKYHRDFYALNSISFDIAQGTTVGIIGQNGAGKSTLLKILTGVLTPTSGHYAVNGKVSSLLELGAGFNPELTGIENVYFNGAMFGFSREEIDGKLDDILAFADIGAFVHQKVRTYSSGMFVRLAFAVAVQVDPEILIVDEALSVGDLRFQQKCFRRMKAFKESGKTVIFVTHDQGTVINFCDHVYWLRDGRVHAHGKPSDVVKKYTSFMAYGMETSAVTGEQAPGVPENPPVPATHLGKGGDLAGLPWEDAGRCASFGDGGAKILSTAFVHGDRSGAAVRLRGGEPVAFYMRLELCRPMENLGIGISVNDHLGNTVFAIPSYVYGYVFPPVQAGQVACCSIRFEFPRVKNGKYSISAAVAEGNQVNHIQHHWVHDTCFVEVVNTDLKYSLGTVVVPESRFDIGIDSE